MKPNKYAGDIKMMLGDQEIIGTSNYRIESPLYKEKFISVIIPVYNRHEESYECVQAVMENTELPSLVTSNESLIL